MAVRSNWLVTYSTTEKNHSAKSVAVPLDVSSLLVTVVTPGANPAHPAVHLNLRELRTEVIGYDSVSRLALLKIEGAGAPAVMKWRKEARGVIGGPLQAVTAAGTQGCRATGWIKQVGVKILPLALLQVSFDRAVPPPGTPLLDPEGRVAAIVFQASGNGDIGYAIPAEAVHRVKRDLIKDGRLQRGWLGLSLYAESKSPKIVKVLANSPAANAGIKPADVLLNVGPHRISSYADAANAFFYLVPGQPVRVTLLRGTNPIEFTVTPTRPQAE